MTDKPLTIVSLEAQNVKRLKAVTITPKGHVVEIAGRNGQGKSSVLDSIMYALGGKDTFCDDPVRKGEQKATIKCDLGELSVTRTITAEGGGTLKVTDANGAALPSPQKVLDALYSTVSFDPLAFARMKPAEQRETLQRMVGLDFAALDAQRETAFAERTEAGRIVKRLEGQLAGLPQHADAPAAEVSVLALSKELQAATEADAAEQRIRDAHAANKKRMQKIDEEIERLRAEWSELAKKNSALEEEIKRLPEPVDADELRQRIAEAEALNRKVRENAKRSEVAAELEASRKRVEALTAKIAEIDAAKEKQLAGAKFPVPGLSFSAQGVTLNGVPFEQASQAEKLKVSVAMGFALNPRLKVLLVRDGSLLDEDSLAAVAAMAQQNGGQVWVETVGKGSDISVVIEDGHVRADAAPEPHATAPASDAADTHATVPADGNAPANEPLVADDLTRDEKIFVRHLGKKAIRAKVGDMTEDDLHDAKDAALATINDSSSSRDEKQYAMGVIALLDGEAAKRAAK